MMIITTIDTHYIVSETNVIKIVFRIRSKI